MYLYVKDGADGRRGRTAWTDGMDGLDGAEVAVLVLADPPRHGGHLRDGGRDRPHVEPMPSQPKSTREQIKNNRSQQKRATKFFTTSEHKPRSKQNKTPQDPAKLHLALGVPDGCPLEGHDLPLATHVRRDHAGQCPHLASRVKQPSSPKTRTSINFLVWAIGVRTVTPSREN